jgi:Putative GTPase activating protein for Arf
MEQLLIDNSTCVDCDSPELEAVNMQYGVFLCGACAAVHSRLLKIPVRKLNDSFLDEEIIFLSGKGNQRINSELMKNVTPWTVSLKTFGFR